MIQVCWPTAAVLLAPLQSYLTMTTLVFQPQTYWVRAPTIRTRLKQDRASIEVLEPLPMVWSQKISVNVSKVIE